jgi:sigma-B regulation protein RsbU (phosphoserine phosphatase)
MQCMEVWGGNEARDNGVTMPGLDAWVYSRPYHGDASGGDLHYVSSCATGRISRFLVADVSGHGAVVSDIAVKLRTLMRRYVNYIDQSHVVQTLNREFSELAKPGKFATAVMLTYWAPTDYVVICNAGHPRPLWYSGRTREWTALDNARQGRKDTIANIPLGVMDPARYDQVSLRLRRGDLLLLYTDSLVEARAAGGRLLGEAGLLNLVRGLDPARPEAMIPELLAAVEKYCEGGTPDDDVTALLLRPNDVRPTMNIRQGLHALGLYARLFVGSLKPGGQPFPWPEPNVPNLLGPFISRFNKYMGGRGTKAAVPNDDGQGPA